MGYQLNEHGAQLLLSVVRRELTGDEAARRLRRKKPRVTRECRIGPYGVCVTHGQVAVECEKGE